MGRDVMSLSHVSLRFGSVQALNDLSFAIREGEILGIAGPNGAGKSTLLGVCTGHVRANKGEIVLGGRSIAGRAPHHFCHAGVARMFQIPQIFSSLSVRENVETGAMFGMGSKSRPGRDPAELLQLTGLSEIADRASKGVDLITRKRIMLAAALATRPRILFMDEPLAGLNEDEITAFADLIAHIHAELDCTIVLVEHKVRALARLSHRIMILNFGRLVRVDTPDKILSDPEIIDLYLGKNYVA